MDDLSFSNLLSMKKDRTPDLTPPTSLRLEAEWQVTWKGAEREICHLGVPITFEVQPKHFAPRQQKASCVRQRQKAPYLDR